MYKRILQIMALAALSLVIFLATPLPPIYAQALNPGHIRFSLTETGLVITWDAMDPEDLHTTSWISTQEQTWVRMMFCGVSRF